MQFRYAPALRSVGTMPVPAACHGTPAAHDRFRQTEPLVLPEDGWCQ